MSSFWFLDTLMKVHMSSRDTGGAYALLECLAPSGHMPPPHVHADDHEGFHVLEGELTFHTGAGPTVVGPGGSAHAPAGEPHTFAVTSDGPARFLMVITGAVRFDAFIEAFGTPAERDELPVLDAPPDLERLMQVAGEVAHVTFVGPPGSVPPVLAETAG